MKKTNSFICPALILSIAAAITGCGNTTENISDIKDPGTSSAVSGDTSESKVADTEPAAEEKTEISEKPDEDNKITSDISDISSETADEEISDNDSPEESAQTEESTAASSGDADDFQKSFKEASINEFRNTLENIRTGILLNNGTETENIIIRSALSLMNWCAGTTLTEDEIRTEFAEYTNTLSKPDINSLYAMYDLVYNEYLTLLEPDQEQKIEDAGCSDISAYPYGTEPLEPAEILHELMKNYER